MDFFDFFLGFLGKSKLGGCKTYVSSFLGAKVASISAVDSPEGESITERSETRKRNKQKT